MEVRYGDLDKTATEGHPQAEAGPAAVRSSYETGGGKKTHKADKPSCVLGLVSFDYLANQNTSIIFNLTLFERETIQKETT